MKKEIYSKVISCIILTSAINMNCYSYTTARYVYTFDNQNNVNDDTLKPSSHRYSFTSIEEAQNYYQSLKAKDPYSPVKLIRKGQTYIVILTPISKASRDIQVAKAREEMRVRQETIAREKAEKARQEAKAKWESKVKQEVIARQAAIERKEAIARERAIKARKEAKLKQEGIIARQAAIAKAKTIRLFNKLLFLKSSNHKQDYSFHFPNYLQGLTKVATLTVGPSWEQNRKTQIIALQPDVQKAFTEENKGKLLANGEIFLGIQKSLTPMLQSEVGLALVAGSNAALTGDIWEDADPDFNNYTYKYSVQHVHIAVKGKLFPKTNYWAQPYLNGSIGIGLNHAHGFSITPKIFPEIPMNNFTDNTIATVTYSLGVGLQKTLSKHWAVGGGYEFANWGKSRLGRSPDQTISNGLTIPNLCLNSLQLSISYIG